MHLQAFVWLVLPLFVAGGSALLAYYIMQARLEVAISKERETLAEVRATLQTAKITMEERIKATEEATRRATLDEVMQDIRIEERSYVRDTNTPAGARRSMVLQERVYFRNIPMSTWTEREMLIEEGPRLSESAVNFDPTLMAAGFATSLPVEPAHIPMASPVPPPPPQRAEARAPISKMLDPVAPARPAAPRREPRTLVAVHAAFGAQ